MSIYAAVVLAILVGGTCYQAGWLAGRKRGQLGIERVFAEWEAQLNENYTAQRERSEAMKRAIDRLTRAEPGVPSSRA